MTTETEHIHNWGPVEQSRFAGTLHRKCSGCSFVSLDLSDDEDDDS